MVTSFSRVFSIVCAWHLPVFVPSIVCQHARQVLYPPYKAWHDKHKVNAMAAGMREKKTAAPDLGDLALGALNAQLGSFQLLLLPLLPLNMLLLLQATCAIESDLAREVDHAGPHDSRYRLEATLQSVMARPLLPASHSSCR